MKTHWIDEEFLYDGSQLRSLFAYQKFGLLKINELQDWYKKSNQEIPIEDNEFYKNLKKEFKWF